MEMPGRAAEERTDGQRNSDLAVILPTFNEGENIAETIRRLEIALRGISWELIFVDDDSPDGTSDIVRKFAVEDRRIRLIQRIGRRGLSSACIEGMLATSASYIAVMDADLQHDESILPAMLQKLRIEALDIVVGTRNAEGVSMGEFSAKRVLLSRFGQRISRSISRIELTDPMSGFFLLRRSFLHKVVHRLHGGGFKILLDMIATSARPARVGEVGYRFRNRRYGKSKLDANAAFEYLSMIVNKLSNGMVPTRFVAFSVVGAIGLLVHFTVLTLLFNILHQSFIAGQAGATTAAMVCNFFLNDLITFRDRSLRGAYKLVGLATFCAGCAFGGFVNVSFAETMLRAGVAWYLAALAGTVISAGWNYSISNLFAWRMPRSRTVNRMPAYNETLSLR